MTTIHITRRQALVALALSRHPRGVLADDLLDDWIVVCQEQRAMSDYRLASGTGGIKMLAAALVALEKAGVCDRPAVRYQSRRGGPVSVWRITMMVSAADIEALASEPDVRVVSRQESARCAHERSLRRQRQRDTLANLELVVHPTIADVLAGIRDDLKLHQEPVSA